MELARTENNKPLGLAAVALFSVFRCATVEVSSLLLFACTIETKKETQLTEASAIAESPASLGSRSALAVAAPASPSGSAAGGAAAAAGTSAPDKGGGSSALASGFTGGVPIAAAPAAIAAAIAACIPGPLGEARAC